jgi:uncharacterized protein with ParB-like and HNH nuclease domain|uniref:Uncharacterized protein n=1 Tax=Desulfobacca acetoxidans TaxID=60893 RepID=A0A7V6DP18_9BACT
METTGERPQESVAQDPEIMKSLALGIVGDMARLFKEHGLTGKPMKIIEALIFAMFVVTETFTAAKKGLDQARKSLDLFHQDMVEYMFTEFLFKDRKARDMEEVQARFQEMRELINQRYQEYRRNFLEDYQDKQMSFRRTFNSLTGYLLPEALSEGQGKDRLIAEFSVKLAHFWSGCLSSFQPGQG